MAITIFHNPDCSTSRNTLALIRNSGDEPRVVEYLDTPPSRSELEAMIAASGRPVADFVRRNREAIRERGAAVGFTFNMDKRSRIYNTFDAHRLLHWAEVLDDEQGTTGENALALKHAFLKAYFTDGQDPSSHDVLVRYATDAGLDGAAAREVLASGRYTQEVREREQYYQQRGIHSVPSIIIDDKHLIQGGQPPELFEQALRQIAANPAA